MSGAVDNSERYIIFNTGDMDLQTEEGELIVPTPVTLPITESSTLAWIEQKTQRGIATPVHDVPISSADGCVYSVDECGLISIPELIEQVHALHLFNAAFRPTGSQSHRIPITVRHGCKIKAALSQRYSDGFVSLECRRVTCRDGVPAVFVAPILSFEPPMRSNDINVSDPEGQYIST